MNNWNISPRAAFDLETTGKEPETARIVTATILLCSPAGEVLQEHQWLVSPGIAIPDAAAEIHGISTEKAVAEGQPAQRAVTEIARTLLGYLKQGIPVVAFNASYDLSVLAAEANRYQIALDAPPSPIIDPFIIDKQLDRYRKGKRTLTAVSEHYGISLENAHTSSADALAASQVAQALAEVFPELERTAVELHQAQVGWAREQAESFAQYLRSQGKTDVVIDPTWPVRLGGQR